MVMYTLDQLEQDIASRVAALDATPWVHDADHPEVWAECDVPMSAQTDSSLAQHLAYSVSVEDAPVVNDANMLDGYVTVLAQLKVSFYYRIRTDDQLRDQRTSHQAARQVAGAVLAPSSSWETAPLNLYRPGAIVNGFIPVDLRFQVLLDVSVPPTP